jgi:hypothetical protein
LDVCIIGVCRRGSGWMNQGGGAVQLHVQDIGRRQMPWSRFALLVPLVAVTALTAGWVRATPAWRPRGITGSAAGLTDAAPLAGAGSSIGSFVLGALGLGAAGGAAVYSVKRRGAASPDAQPAGTQPGPHHCITDDVYFSLTTARELRPGRYTSIEFWAHLAAQRGEVLRRAGERLNASAAGPAVRLAEKGPAAVERGTVLEIDLTVRGLLVESPCDTVRWVGEIGTCGFLVHAPDDAVVGEYPGTCRVAVAGVAIAQLHFLLPVVAESRPPAGPAAAPGPIPARQYRFQSAFASYASADREQVITVLQGLKKAVPQMDVFLDVCSLRAGDRWEQELMRQIPSRDVFYLFWSAAASKSRWVDREWRYALAARGIEFIDPIPLVDGARVPPPPELAELHFGDPLLRFKAAGARGR